MTTPPGPKPEDTAAPLEGRVQSIEAEQKRQGGMLDQILGKLTGDQEGDTTVTTGSEPPAGPGDMAEQMRQAVRDVQAEADAEVGRQQRLGKRPEPETTPREVMVKGKERLQRTLFGGDPR
jgi:hypothetical protein